MSILFAVLVLFLWKYLGLHRTRTDLVVCCTASRMSYLCSTNKKYCVSLWEFYVVGPQSGRDDVRPRGNEQPAECVRRRPSMCFVGDTLFTAVLIPMLGGYLLVDDTLASWSDMLRLRRYWYLFWADTFWLTIHLFLGRTCCDGGTDTPAGRTSLGRRYSVLRRACTLPSSWASWANITCVALANSAGTSTTLRRLRKLRRTYTSQLAGRTSYLAGTRRT